MRKSKIQRMVGIAMLGAVAYVLMFLSFPVIPAYAFMKVDFSEIPILIGAYIFGPFAAVGIAAVRSILHFLTTGVSIPNMVGDLASFLAGISFVLPVYFLSNKKATTKQLAGGLVLGTLLMTSVMMFSNYSFILPVYAKFMGFQLPGTLASYIVFGVLPFNLIKAVIVSTAFVLVYKKLLPWLEKKQNLGHHLQ